MTRATVTVGFRFKHIPDFFKLRNLGNGHNAFTNYISKGQSSVFKGFQALNGRIVRKVNGTNPKMVLVRIRAFNLLVRIMKTAGLVFSRQIGGVVKGVQIPIRIDRIAETQTTQRLTVRVFKIRLFKLVFQDSRLNSFRRLNVDVEMVFLTAFVVFCLMVYCVPLARLMLPESPTLS